MNDRLASRWSDVRQFSAKPNIVLHRVQRRVRTFMRPFQEGTERALFANLLQLADIQFQTGNFARASEYIVEAGTVQRDAAHKFGLSFHFPRLLCSEVTNAFGHLAVAPDLRMKASRLGLVDELPVLVATPSAANEALVDYWREHLPSIDLPIRKGAALEETLWPLIDSVQWLTLQGQVHHLYSAMAEVEIAWELGGFEPVLSVSNEHRERGEEVLRSLGIPEGEWFVSMHVRSLRGGKNYGRNARSTTYLEAVRQIRNAGGHVIQVGQDALQEPAAPEVINPAQHGHRQPWLDLFLLGTSRFHIGTQSGPNNVAAAFGTPVLMTNATGWGFLPYTSKSIAIPKHIAHAGRALTLTEMIQEGLVFLDGFLPKHSNLTWLDNTPEQLGLGVEEMLDCRWNSPLTSRDVELDALHNALVGYRGVRLSCSQLV